MEDCCIKCRACKGVWCVQCGSWCDCCICCNTYPCECPTKSKVLRELAESEGFKIVDLKVSDEFLMADLRGIPEIDNFIQE